MSDTTNPKTLSRRSLIKGAAAATGAMAFPYVRAADPITLRYLGTAVNQDKAIADKFKADTGIEIQYIPVTTDDVGQLFLSKKLIAGQLRSVGRQ